MEYSAEQQLLHVPSEKGPQPEKKAFGTNKEGEVMNLSKCVASPIGSPNDFPLAGYLLVQSFLLSV